MFKIPINSRHSLFTYSIKCDNINSGTISSTLRRPERAGKVIEMKEKKMITLLYASEKTTVQLKKLMDHGPNFEQASFITL